MTAPAVDLKSICAPFRVFGEFRGGAPHGSGHINDSYAVTYDQAGTPVRYFVQRVNHNIFKNVPALMENVERVTAHLQNQLAADGAGQPTRRALTLVPTRDGRCWHRCAAGNYWRMYLFIEGARTHDVITSAGQAERAAAAFGRFQGLLTTLPGGRLHDTIPDFHNTPARFAQFQAALQADAANRAAAARPEIELALRFQPITTRLLDLHARGEMPERITHNDTKLNNVMLDDASGEGICVVDLDTVMPGLALYDFGDMVRTGTNSSAEDELDLGRTFVRLDQFEALVRGYLSTARAFLTPAERDHLAFAGQLITFEIGLRFLTDFLAGDVYFKIKRPAHNLERCRTQFKLAAQMGELADRMNAIVKTYS